jgi:hypothetical protein
MSRSRWVRAAMRTVLVALVVAVCAGIACCSAAPASAAASPSAPMLPIPGLPDCQTPPTPQSPDRGLGGFITPRPADPPPINADPFTDGSGVSLYETTGLAGYRWHMYVDSCLPGPGQATNGALNSTANSLMSLPVLAVGTVATLADAVYNQTWLEVLDRPVAYVSDALYDGFTRPFFPVLAVAVGVVMLVSIRRARLSAAIGTGVLVLVAGTLASFAANYPRTVADVTDQVTATAIVAVNGTIAGSDDADPATATIAPLVDAILFDRWVAGTLGDSSSPTARQYGPELYEASTLTWAETQLVRADPDGAGADLLDDKRQQWRDATAAVQESDPDAYEYLTGARSLDRVGHALVALALIGILPFLLMSLLLVAMSYLIIRLVVMFLPMVALVALLLRGTLRSLASLTAAAVVNSVVFAVGAAVTVYLYGVFLSPDSGIPALLGILLAFLVGIAMWIVLSPYRRLTTMVRGTDAVKTTREEYRRYKKATTDLAGGAARFAGGSAKVAAGSLLASKVRGRQDDTGSRRDVDSEPYRIGPDTIRPEHFVTAAPATPGDGYRTGPPAELLPAGTAPLVAIAAPRARALPAPRDHSSMTDAQAGSATPPRATPERIERPIPLEPGSTPLQTPPGGPPVTPDFSAARSGDAVGTGLPEDGPDGCRPEMMPVQGFDPVVVDGRSAVIIHTLDGPVLDPQAGGATDVAGDPQVVTGEVVTSRRGTGE